MEHPTIAIAIPVSPSRCQLQELFHHFPRDDLPRDDLPRDDKVKFKDSSEKPPKKRMKFKHQVSDEVPIHMPGSPLPSWMDINRIGDNIELNKLRRERGRSKTFHEEWTI